MNSNTFNCNRFWKVLAKDFRSIWPLFGMTMLIIVLIPTLVWLLCTVLGLTDNIPVLVRWTEILLTILFVGCMAPARIYHHNNLPKEGIYFAMLPASKWEKFLSILVITCVVCPVIALAGGLVIDGLLTLLPFGPYNHWLFGSAEINEMVADLKSYDEANGIVLFERMLQPWYWIIDFLSYFVTFVFTATIFKKHKVLYTILWIWLIGFAFELIATPILIAIGINEPNWAFALSEWAQRVGPQTVVNILFYSSMAWNIVYTVGLGVWAWFRTKNMKY